MKKMFAVLKREYLQTVRKPMFKIMTVAMPLLMLGLFYVPQLMIAKGMGTKRIAVLDATGQLRDTFMKEEPEEKPSGISRRDLPGSMTFQYVNVADQPNLVTAAKPFFQRMNSDDKEQRLDGVLVVPKDAIASSDAHLKFYSRSATDIITQQRLGGQAGRGIHRIRLAARGVAAADLDKLLSDVSVEGVQLSKTGEQKKGGGANFIIGFVLTALVILPAFIYGLEIMRGIIQEKTDRVVEVLVSSMSASQLLVGKILGIAAVGLTQVSVWILMGAAGAAWVGANVSAMTGENYFALLRPATFGYFGIFFMLAYLTYVCVYAVAGSVCNSEKEAQQLIGPITMLMMLPWFLLVGIITNPDSTLSVAFSLMPVFGPITMYVRTLVAEPPVWHILLSIAISIGTIAVFFWATSKIFRVGILSYGKRPTIPELWRWLKVA